jgi:hypothetical protein
MEKKPLLKKGLAVSVILLFIGLAIAPSINFNTVKASDEDDFVEVTSQACGINGYGNTTVKLTREQYQNLEEYLVEFRARLNQTSTREEAVPIFKEAVVELDKYGLLPKGMSVEKVQKLVTTNQAHPDVEKLMNSPKFSLSHLEFNNVFCLLSMLSVVPGNDVTFGLLTLPSVILFMIFTMGMFHFNNLELAMLVAIPLLLSVIVGIPSLIFNLLSPLLLWAVVIINSGYQGLSLGLKGLQPINQNFQFLIGFKGLRIWLPVSQYDRISFYLGQAFATASYVP